jgi:ribonuclease P protein component
MKSNNRFSQLFKLDASTITAAFAVASRKGSTLGVKLLHAPHAEKNGFIIALTKGIKGGVKRNTLRRRFKAILHAGIQAHGPFSPGIYLCIVYPEALTRSYHDLQTWLVKTMWPRTR